MRPIRGVVIAAMHSWVELQTSPQFFVSDFGRVYLRSFGTGCGQTSSMSDQFSGSEAECQSGAMKPMLVDPLVSTGTYNVGLVKEGEGQPGPVIPSVARSEEKAEGKSCLVMRPWEGTKVEGLSGPVKPGKVSLVEGQPGPVKPSKEGEGQPGPVIPQKNPPKVDRVMPSEFCDGLAWSDLGPIMDKDKVVIGYLIGLEPHKGLVFFSKRPTFGVKIFDTNLVDKFGMALWVEDGYPFSASDMQTFMDIQELGHCTEWLTHASSPVRAKASDAPRADALTQDLIESMDGCSVSDDEMLGNSDIQSCLQDPEWIRARTVVVQIEYNQLRTSIRRDDVIDAIVSQAGVGTAEMVGLDPVSGGPHWEVVLKTRRATERLIKKGSVRIGGKFTARLMALGEELVQMCLLWLPLRVTNKDIARWASHFASDIVSIEYEKVGGEGRGKVMSFARTVVVRMKKGYSKEDDIPHKGPVVTSDGESFVSLILVKGRASLCLKCGDLGHVRQNCGALWCSLCRRWTDHGYNSCYRRGQSFANIARNQGQGQGQAAGQGKPQGKGTSAGASVASELVVKKGRPSSSVDEEGWETKKSKKSKKSQSVSQEEGQLTLCNQFAVLEGEQPQSQREKRVKKRASEQEGKGEGAGKSRRQQEEEAPSGEGRTGTGGADSSSESLSQTPMEESLPCGQGDPAEPPGGTSQDTLPRTDLGLTSEMSDLVLSPQASEAGSNSKELA